MAEDKPKTAPIEWPVTWTRVGERWYWATSSTTTNGVRVPTGT